MERLRVYHVYGVVLSLYAQEHVVSKLRRWTLWWLGLCHELTHS